MMSMYMLLFVFCFFFKQKTAYEMRISDWSSDVCSSDLIVQVTASTQHPSETQRMVAHVLGLPVHRVVCRSLRMGGGFGGKETQANSFAAQIGRASCRESLCQYV